MISSPLVLFFFFKQKTAYDMRISDWSSDVCSSDLLWNEVEAGEKRKDAQLAREVEFSIPRELNQQQGIQLARDFVEKQFVERGMVADMNVHWDMGKDGQPKPHAHVMLSMREVGPDGFGKKVVEWNSTAMLQEWRVAWADYVNVRLAELDIDARIAHRRAEGHTAELQHPMRIP